MLIVVHTVPGLRLGIISAGHDGISGLCSRCVCRGCIFLLTQTPLLLLLVPPAGIADLPRPGRGGGCHQRHCIAVGDDSTEVAARGCCLPCDFDQTV